MPAPLNTHLLKDCRQGSYEAMQVSKIKAGYLIACYLLRREMEVKAQSTDNGAGSGQLKEMPGTYPHFSVAILLLYGMNTGLSKFTQTAGIQFPSALIGMQSRLTTIEDVKCCGLHHDNAPHYTITPCCRPEPGEQKCLAHN